MKAIRGAITVDANTPEAIAEATQTLLAEIGRRNGLSPENVISAFFTLTPDLDADFPARAARAAGWDMPMLDTQEVGVPGALRSCLRVLLHVQLPALRAQPSGSAASTASGSDEPVRHVYLRGAATLRPDLEGAQ